MFEVNMLSTDDLIYFLTYMFCKEEDLIRLLKLTFLRVSFDLLKFGIIYLLF
jgi:hypothetical protein